MAIENTWENIKCNASRTEILIFQSSIVSLLDISTMNLLTYANTFLESAMSSDNGNDYKNKKWKKALCTNEPTKYKMLHVTFENNLNKRSSRFIVKRLNYKLFYLQCCDSSSQSNFFIHRSYKLVDRYFIWSTLDIDCTIPNKKIQAFLTYIFLTKQKV